MQRNGSRLALKYEAVMRGNERLETGMEALEHLRIEWSDMQATIAIAAHHAVDTGNRQFFRRKIAVQHLDFSSAYNCQRTVEFPMDAQDIAVHRAGQYDRIGMVGKFDKRSVKIQK